MADCHQNRQCLESRFNRERHTANERHFCFSRYLRKRPRILMELLLDLHVLVTDSTSDVVKETIAEFESYGAWCY